MPTLSHPIYLRSAACICPREGEPDYRSLLDPKLIRRMSRIIRMGAAAALTCLREAAMATPDSTAAPGALTTPNAIARPDAIVTGTAYGCLEDTGLFLNSMIERHEELLQPATFIQSTHNTVGAQIALLLDCTGYNNTFVHRGFSFESALLDAILMLADEEAATVLVGGIDELTTTSQALLQRFGLFRRTMAGEGAAFFLLTREPTPGDCVRLDGLATFYRPSGDEEVKQKILSFLGSHSLTTRDIDLVITGDKDGISTSLFPGTPNMTFKQRSGEYPTAASFALWLAAQQVKSGVGRVLLYNNYLGIYHSVYLLSHVAE